LVKSRIADIPLLTKEGNLKFIGLSIGMLLIINIPI
jgi:hypothetical protein